MRPIRLEINLSAIKNNLNIIRKNVLIKKFGQFVNVMLMVME